MPSTAQIFEYKSEFPLSHLINVENVKLGRKLTIISMRPSSTDSKGHDESHSSNTFTKFDKAAEKNVRGASLRVLLCIMLTRFSPLITQTISFPGNTGRLFRLQCSYIFVVSAKENTCPNHGELQRKR